VADNRGPDSGPDLLGHYPDPFPRAFRSYYSRDLRGHFRDLRNLSSDGNFGYAHAGSNQMRTALFDHQRALINSLWEPVEGESRLFDILVDDRGNITEETWRVTAKYVSVAGRELLWEKVE
jgi:hypothetical protein